MAYCPIGFAHGFCVLSDVADVMYKQSNYYADETERGIAYNDPEVGIEWPLPVEDLIPSARDATAPRLSEIADELPFRYEALARERLTHVASTADDALRAHARSGDHHHLDQRGALARAAACRPSSASRTATSR